MKKVIATTAAPGAIGPYSQAIDTGTFEKMSAMEQKGGASANSYISKMFSSQDRKSVM